jgi:hypothetical protein
MSFEKPEKFSEQPKECLIKKLDVIYNFFSSEKLVYCEDLLVNLEKLVNEVEKIKPESIAPNNHMVDVLGQLLGKLGFVKIVRNIPEKKEKETNKFKGNEYRQIVLQTKETLKNYTNLCLSNKDFFYGEFFSQLGYWEEKTLDGKEDGKKIAKLNADEFVQISKEHFKEKNNPSFNFSP